jgi:CubicO group peptidase (beta-lactamase class C family)
MRHFLILIILVFPKLIFGQAGWLDSLDNYIAKEVIDYNVPGLAIGIIKDDTIIFKHCYGEANLNTHSKVSQETVFPIASCTKTFTATCIGILVDEGKLQWNDKVIKYLPDFKLSDPQITKELTISDLLTHRTGLAQFEGDLLWYGTNYSSKEIIDRMQYYPIKSDFRTQFAYQNVMYLVAGMIIERVSGKTWHEFLKEKIFTPLSMDKTTSSISQLPLNNYAVQYLGNQQAPFINYDNAGPCSSVNSNIHDMLNWLQMWIGQGVYNENTILSRDVYQTMTSPKMITNNPDESYGFGWYIGTEKGEKVIFHNGFLPGCRSTVFIIPEMKIGIVILTNKINFLNDEILNVVADNLLNPGKTNWEQARKESSSSFLKGCQYCWDKERREVEKLNPSSPSDFSKYESIYEDKIYGKAIVTQKDGRPFLELIPTKDLFSGYMYFLNENQFTVIFNDKFLRPGKVNFEIDSVSKQIV